MDIFCDICYSLFKNKQLLCPKAKIFLYKHLINEVLTIYESISRGSKLQFRFNGMVFQL